MAQSPASGRPRRGATLRSEHFTLGLPPTARIAAGHSQGIVLLMAIPKRQLKRAVDRNTVRRIAREAWRASALATAGCAGADAAPARGAGSPQAPVSALLRLVIRPQGFAALAQGARKRMWRMELDTLFASALALRAR